MLSKMIAEGNQQMVNLIAYELTVRLYVPNTSYTFEETLYGLGYKNIEPVNEKQISIEEYMRERKKNDEC